MNIDLNADLAEGYGDWRMGDDDALLDVLSSANLACGFHAGDPTIMQRTVRRARDRGVETQLEGGMIYGLSAALFGEITVKNGRVEQGNFDTYPVARYKDAPKTEVYISPTPGKRWGGVGEPGATMIQPAITNAIFAATGKRLRTLPIRGQDLSGGA